MDKLDRTDTPFQRWAKETGFVKQPQTTKIVGIELTGEETIEWTRTINVVVPIDATDEEINELDSDLLEESDCSFPNWEAVSSGIDIVDHSIYEPDIGGWCLEPVLTLTRNVSGQLELGKHIEEVVGDFQLVEVSE